MINNSKYFSRFIKDYDETFESILYGGKPSKILDNGYNILRNDDSNSLIVMSPEEEVLYVGILKKKYSYADLYNKDGNLVAKIHNTKKSTRGAVHNVFRRYYSYTQYFKIKTQNKEIEVKFKEKFLPSIKTKSNVKLINSTYSCEYKSFRKSEASFFKYDDLEFELIKYSKKSMSIAGLNNKEDIEAIAIAITFDMYHSTDYFHPISKQK